MPGTRRVGLLPWVPQPGKRQAARGRAESPSPPGWLTAAEAAEQLRVQRSTLYSYVSRGLVDRRAMPNSRSYFRRDQIEEMARRRAERKRSDNPPKRQTTRRQQPATKRNDSPPPPKSFLAVLLLCLLRNRPAHGYELVLRLRESPLWRIDGGNLYRIMRVIEEDGLVETYWEPSAKGPLRRTYRLTTIGERRLRAWIELLRCDPTFRLLVTFAVGTAPSRT